MDDPRRLGHDTPMNTTHGQRSVHDRRLTNAQHIAFYLQAAKLARAGIDTRRTEAFYLRQVEYFRTNPEG